MTGPVRVRIAPSPTGFTHVGNLRTAVFNWLWARKNGGAFVWRVEDTDRTRFVEAALHDFRDSLTWLGIEPDEGPFTGGPYGPYVQSERLPRYREAAEAMLAAGAAYRCFCAPRGGGEEAGPEPRAGGAGDDGGSPSPGDRVAHGGYDRRCRDLDAATIQARLDEGAPFTIRLRMPLEGTLALEDAIHGRLEWQAEHFNDPIIVKTDGFPTYHLAVCVDDAAMEISHVMRADEWLGSSPYHIVINRALGIEPPIYVHVPMVLNPDGRGKLSKRKTVTLDGEGAVQDGHGVAMVQAREFRAAGYLPEAMFNYLVLLGWSYSGDEELFTPREAIERFELADIHKAGARWDPEKLDWMNGHYIRQLDPAELGMRLLPFLAAEGFPPDDAGTLDRIVALVRERITTLAEAPGWVTWLWRDVDPPAEAIVVDKLGADGTVTALDSAAHALEAVEEWTAESIEAALRGLAERLGLKAGPLFSPIRVAVTGGTVAPPLFDSLALMERPVVVERLRRARDRVAGA